MESWKGAFFSQFLQSNRTIGLTITSPTSTWAPMPPPVPVVSTRHGGIPEVVSDRVPGLLVPERDHEELARVLLNAAQDPVFLSRIARSGAEVVRKNFGLDAQAQRLEEMYLKLLQDA